MRRNARIALVALAAAAAALGVAARDGRQDSRAHAAPAATPRPNIVFLIADDQPPLDGRLLDRMPVTNDVFRNHGVQFSDFHAETPLCCPGRAGYMTGQHTFNHGVDANHANLFDPSMSVATQLHGIGYHTFLVGKYFNDYERIAPDVPPGWDVFQPFGNNIGYY